MQALIFAPLKNGLLTGLSVNSSVLLQLSPTLLLESSEMLPVCSKMNTVHTIDYLNP